MAVTCGFFNSVNGDRKYDARQMARPFDGIITDGVYANIYKQFRVQPNEGLTVQVDTGQGWFEHTWINNDGIYLVTLTQAEILLDRIDAIVIEVDHRDVIRDDFIKVVKGIPSSDPAKPTMKKGEDDIWQFPLAYITVHHGTETIDVADIENKVGSSECPFVTGAVSAVDTDMLISQWGAQWTRWYNTNTKAYANAWSTWYNTHTSQYNYDFNDWFSQLQAMLDGNVAANMANEILKLKNKFKKLFQEHILTESIDDTIDYDPILDSEGREIEGDIFFCVKSADNICNCG